MFSWTGLTDTKTYPTETSAYYNTHQVHYHNQRTQTDSNRISRVNHSVETEPVDFPLDSFVPDETNRESTVFGFQGGEQQLTFSYSAASPAAERIHSAKMFLRSPLSSRSTSIEFRGKRRDPPPAPEFTKSTENFEEHPFEFDYPVYRFESSDEDVNSAFTHEEEHESLEEEEQHSFEEDQPEFIDEEINHSPINEPRESPESSPESSNEESELEEEEEETESSSTPTSEEDEPETPSETQSTETAHDEEETSATGYDEDEEEEETKDHAIPQDNFSFMRSILHILFHINSFMTQISASTTRTDPHQQSLCRELAKMYHDSERFSLDRFLSVWTAILPIDEGHEHDPVEFFGILAEQCQREIASVISSSEDVFSRKLMFRYDPFSSCFGISLLSRVQCPHCREYRGQNRTSLVLYVSLTESVEESIRSFFETEWTEVMCEKCTTPSSVSYSITRLPPVLFVLLERFSEAGEKVQGAVFANEYLDLSDYTDGEVVCEPGRPLASAGSVEEDDASEPAPWFEFEVVEDEPLVKRAAPSRAGYRLCGAILHYGSTIGSGHYTAAFREDGEWILYDGYTASPGDVDPESVYCLIYQMS